MFACIGHWLTSCYWGGIVVGSILSPLLLGLWSWGVKCMFRRFWPSPDEKRRAWRYLTSYGESNKRWTEDGWRSPKPQQIEAFFEIDLQKERYIKAIQFYHGESFETPKKWYMTISAKNRGYRFFDTNLVRKQGEGLIMVYLREPQNVQFIRVVIAQPEVGQNGQPYYWTIKAIRLKEIRLPYIWEPIIT